MPDESSEQGTVRYIRCPSCGTPNPGASLTCSRCGKNLHGAETGAGAGRAPAQAAQQVVCPKCKKPLPPRSKFCGFCGASLSAPPPATPVKTPERVTTAQSGPSTVAPKAPAPVLRPASPPPAAVTGKVAPLKPVSSPEVKVAPTPPVTPKPLAVPIPPKAEGTVVFTGLHVPKVEASMTEVKPDGSLGKTVRIVKETFIGRGNCDATYPNDVLLSPRHSSVRIQEGKVLLKDLNSQNGTFVKQRQDTELVPGDVFLLGRELFRFATQSLDESQASPQGTMVMSGAPKLQRGPVTAKLEHIQLSGDVIEEFKLEKPETTLGRTQGDLVFKNDPYMSGAHARIVAQPGRFILQDLRSRNGIYRRIRGEVELRDGDEFFLGEQLFRVDTKTS